MPRPEKVPDDDERWECPCALYRYYTGDGTLLYIGISRQPHERHRQHHPQMWFPYARFRSHEIFPDRVFAEWAERHAIANEEPEFNSDAKPPADLSRTVYRWYPKLTGGEPVGVGPMWSMLAWPESGGVAYVPLRDCDDPKLPPHKFSDMHLWLCQKLIMGDMVIPSPAATQGNL